VTSTSKVQKAVRAARQAVYREAVLAAGEESFAQHGYEAAHMQSIAEHAGISVGVLYATFESKAALFKEIQRVRTATLIERTRDIVESGAPPLAMLRLGVRATVRFFADHRAYLRMHLRDRASWADPSLGTDCQQDAYAIGVGFVESALALGIEDGTVVDESPRTLARAVLAIIQMRLAEWAEGDFTTPVDELVRVLEAMIDRLVRR
jgi:AcrR family transcriptional regulator